MTPMKLFFGDGDHSFALNDRRRSVGLCTSAGSTG